MISRRAVLTALLATMGLERGGFYLFLAVYVLYRASLGDTEKAAEAAVGFALACVYGSTFIGGVLGQRFGFKRTALAGLLALSAAYAALAGGAPQWAWMATLSVAMGMFKPSIPILIGRLTAKDLERVQNSTMSLYYGAVNVGGFLGPFVAGFLVGSYHLAFALSSASCLLAAAAFALGWGQVQDVRAERPKDPTQDEAVAIALGRAAKGYSRGVWKRLFSLCLLAMVFWTGYNAFFGSVVNWIKSEVDRVVWSHEVSVPWFNAENGLIILVVSFLWPSLMSTWRMSSRIISALACSAAAFSVLVAFKGHWIAPAGVAAGVVLVETIAEMCISPLGLSRIAALAPSNRVGWYTGLWFLANAVGGYLSGRLSFGWMVVVLVVGTIAASALRWCKVLD